MLKRSFIILAITIFASSSLAVPVTDDLWDVSQGTVVTNNSPIYPGSSARNMFGANEGTVEAGWGRTLFTDGCPAGTEHWVQWKTEDIVALSSFKLYAFHDGGTNDRSFDRFSLSAKDLVTGEFTQIYDTNVTVPYNFIGGEENFVAQHTLDTPITAQEFKAIFRQHNSYHNYGPRIIELDGFWHPRTGNNLPPRPWRLESDSLVSAKARAVAGQKEVNEKRRS